MRYINKEYMLEFDYTHRHPITNKAIYIIVSLIKSKTKDVLGSAWHDTSLHCLYQLIENINRRGYPGGPVEGSEKALPWLVALQKKLEEKSIDGRCCKR